MIVTMDNGAAVFIGSLNIDEHGAEARVALGDGFADAAFYRSAGRYDNAALAGTEAPARHGLNADALRLTNCGDADMFWADPRFTEPAPAMTRDQLAARLAGPWAPTVISLSTSGPDIEGSPTGADVRMIRPEALASSFASLAGERELVIHADDQESRHARQDSSCAWDWEQRSG